MIAFTINIPEKLNQDLILAAEKAERTKTDLARKAIKQYVYELLEDIKDADIALERSGNPDRKFLTSNEMIERLKARRDNV